MPEVYDERGEPVGFEEPMPQEQPVMAPQQAAQAPFIAPSLAGRTDVMPGPRGGMVVPQGGGGVGPNPQDQSNVNAYMEQMAKAGQLDKAQKDVEQAMRFLGMRGVEKDVQGGMAYHEALSKHLPYISYNNPAQAAAYSKIIQQAQPLSMQNLDGVRVLRTPRGDRIVPQNAIPQPPVTAAQSIPFTDPSGQSIEDHFAVPSPTGKGFTVHRRGSLEPQMTPLQRSRELNNAIKIKMGQIQNVPWPEKGTDAEKAQRQSEIGKLNTQLKQLEAQRDSIGSTKPKDSGAAAPPKAERKVGQVYQTPKGPHRWTADGWEPVK